MSYSELIDFVVNSGKVRINASYYLKVPKEWGFEPRCIDDFHIVFCKSGQGGYNFGDKTETFKRNKIIFASNNTEFGAFQNQSDSPSIIPIRFDLTGNKEAIWNVKNQTPYHFAFTPVNSYKYQELFEKLYTYSVVDNAKFKKLAGNVLEEILINIHMDKQENKKKAYVIDKIDEVKQFIDHNICERYTLEVLAEKAGISIKYFSKCFREKYGESPGNYIINKRIQYARFLLEETDKSVKEVAYMLGYTNPYAFSAQFKKFTGTTPSSMKR